MAAVDIENAVAVNKDLKLRRRRQSSEWAVVVRHDWTHHERDYFVENREAFGPFVPAAPGSATATSLPCMELKIRRQAWSHAPRRDDRFSM